MRTVQQWMLTPHPSPLGHAHLHDEHGCMIRMLFNDTALADIATLRGYGILDLNGVYVPVTVKEIHAYAVTFRVVDERRN